MALNTAFVGKTYSSADSYLVGREKIREFAMAIGDFNPAYHDVAAARALGHPDLVAPPTFAFVISYRAMAQVVGDPELGMDYNRVVHGEESFEYRRPICAGDELVVESQIEGTRIAGKNELIDLRQELRTLDGEAVAVTRAVIVSRGTAAQEG